MIAGYDVTPLLGLRLRTPRLELRLPAEDELAQLARVARQGVHPRDEMPFLIPWTDALDSPSFAEGFVRYHRKPGPAGHRTTGAWNSASGGTDR